MSQLIGPRLIDRRKKNSSCGATKNLAVQTASRDKASKIPNIKAQPKRSGTKIYFLWTKTL